MNQENASCTWPNAEAIWKISPSGTLPVKKRGALTTSGKMIATWP